jgi:hypothetical protein
LWQLVRADALEYRRAFLFGGDVGAVEVQLEAIRPWWREPIRQLS